MTSSALRAAIFNVGRSLGRDADQFQTIVGDPREKALKL